MAKAEILYPDGFIGREGESEMKGWLSVHVKLQDGKICSLTFYDPTRMAQEIEDAVNSGRPYFGDVGMIVIEAVTPSSIERAVEALVEDRYFDAFVSADR